MSRVDNILAKYGAKRSGDMGNLGAADAASSRSDEILRKYGAKRSGDFTYIAADKDEPSLLDRVGNTLSGMVQRQASGYAGAAENLLEGAKRLDMLNSSQNKKAQQELENAAHYREMLKRGTLDDGTAIDDTMRANLEAWAKSAERRAGVYSEANEAIHQPISGLINKTDAFGDKMSAGADVSFAKAKDGAGTVGQIAVDWGAALGDVLADAAANAVLPGAGIAARVARSYGQGAELAEDKGMGLGKQLAYGATSAALGELTNRAFSSNPILKKATGSGALDDIILPGLEKTLPGSVVKSALGEATEEGAESIADYFAQKAIFGDQADEFSWKDVGYDALIGGLVGVATGVSTAGRGQNAAMPGAGTQAVSSEGKFTPAQKEGAQGVVTGNFASRAKSEIEADLAAARKALQEAVDYERYADLAGEWSTVSNAIERTREAEAKVAQLEAELSAAQAVSGGVLEQEIDRLSGKSNVTSTQKVVDDVLTREIDRIYGNKNAAAVTVDSGQVTNRQAEAVLADPEQVARLGIDLSGKTKAQQRAAVKAALEAGNPTAQQQTGGKGRSDEQKRAAREKPVAQAKRILAQQSQERQQYLAAKYQEHEAVLSQLQVGDKLIADDGTVAGEVIAVDDLGVTISGGMLTERILPGSFTGDGVISVLEVGDGHFERADGTPIQSQEQTGKQAKAEADTDAGIPIDSPEGRQQFPYTNRVLDDSREGAGTARENAIGADGRRSIGSAAGGFSVAGTEGTEQVSRMARHNPYNAQQEAATAMTKEDYDKLFRYESQTEERSTLLAEGMLYMVKDGQRTFLKDIDEESYSELIRSLEEASAWNGPQTDAAHMIQRELQGRSVNMEVESEEYVDWLRIMREHETATGQGVQANAKWSRTGNESGASSEMDAWKNLEKSNLSDQEKQEVFRQVVKWDSEIETAKSAADLKRIIMEIANRRGVVNGVMGKQFSRIAESALDSLTTEQLRQFAYRSSSALTTDNIPTNWGQKAKTIQVLNMLSSPKTPGRNILGNTTFYGLDALAMDAASILDMAVAQVTGTRSVAAGGSSLREAVQAMKMSIAEITLDVNMGTDNRYTTGSNRTFKASGNFVERVLSSLERNQAYLLNATDEFFKGAARSTQTATQKLVDQGKIKNTGKDFAKTQAEQLAKYRTFQDETILSRWMQGLHDLLNMIGFGDSGKRNGSKTVHAFGAGDIIAPFTRVAGNLVSRGLDYSPLNVMKGTVEIVRQVANAAGNQTVDTTAQARGVSDLARGLTGTGIAYGFMLLAKTGLLRQAEDEDDPDVAALNQSEGMRGTQLNLSAAQRALAGGSAQWQNGDILVDLASIQPLNTLMNLGTEMAKEEQNPFVSLYHATKNSAMDASVELPVMQTVGNMATDIIRYNEDPTEVILRESANTLASSVIPNALSGLAKGLDDRPRNTYADDSLTGNIADNVKNRVPGLRQTLPGSVNSMGQEKVYLEGEGGIFNSLFNPIGVNVYDQSEVSREMERVRENTGNTSFYPSKSIPKALSSDGETMELSYEERQQFQRERGTTILVVMSEMMGTSTYKRSGSEEQSALLDLCSEYAYQEAKATVMGDDAVDSWVTAARDARRNGGLSTGAFLACRYLTSGLEGDKDKDGSTISGSLKQKVMDKIDSMNISKQAKDYCFQQKYPKSDLKDTPWH